MLLSDIKTATSRKLDLFFFLLLPLNGNHEISYLHLRRLGKGGVEGPWVQLCGLVMYTGGTLTSGLSVALQWSIL